jgi:hypothetical protein
LSDEGRKNDYVNPFLQPHEIHSIIDSFINLPAINQEAVDAMREIRLALNSKRHRDKGVRHIYVIMFALTNGKFLAIRKFVESTQANLKSPWLEIAFLIAAKSFCESYANRSIPAKAVDLAPPPQAFDEITIRNPTNSDIRFIHPYFAVVFINLCFAKWVANMPDEVGTVINTALDKLSFRMPEKMNILMDIFFYHTRRCTKGGYRLVW